MVLQNNHGRGLKNKFVLKLYLSQTVALYVVN